MSEAIASDVTVNGQAWALRPARIAQLLGGASPGSVIPDPGGLEASPDRMAAVTDPGFWAGQHDALAEALATSPKGEAPLAETPWGTGQASGAASTTREGRLALTVEEAAALLGISRAFAYESIRRGEIPSIRIGPGVLVPRGRPRPPCCIAFPRGSARSEIVRYHSLGHPHLPR